MLGDLFLILLAVVQALGEATLWAINRFAMKTEAGAKLVESVVSHEHAAIRRMNMVQGIYLHLFNPPVRKLLQSRRRRQGAVAFSKRLDRFYPRQSGGTCLLWEPG